jgi:RNA polymerase sigma-70 factor, ECF subfamily
MNANPNSPPDIEELVRGYYGAVVRLCRSILDDGACADAADEADDAAQEAFIAAARALPEYRGTASPKTWLFAIAINTCRMRLRRRKARRALASTLAGLQRLFGAAEDLQQQAEFAERDALLWRAVDRLEGKHRIVVVLRYAHELSAGEIAQVLGINEGTVHSRLHYARQQLARQLKDSTAFQEAAVP